MWNKNELSDKQKTFCFKTPENEKYYKAQSCNNIGHVFSDEGSLGGPCRSRGNKAQTHIKYRPRWLLQKNMGNGKKKQHQSRGSNRDAECKRDGKTYGNDGISKALVRLFKKSKPFARGKRPSLFLESSSSPSCTFSSFSLILLPCPFSICLSFSFLFVFWFSYMSTYPFCPFLLSRIFPVHFSSSFFSLSIHFIQVPSFQCVLFLVLTSTSSSNSLFCLHPSRFVLRLLVLLLLLICISFSGPFTNFLPKLHKKNTF